MRAGSNVLWWWLTPKQCIWVLAHVKISPAILPFLARIGYTLPWTLISLLWVSWLLFYMTKGGDLSVACIIYGLFSDLLSQALTDNQVVSRVIALTNIFCCDINSSSMTQYSWRIMTEFGHKIWNQILWFFFHLLEVWRHHNDVIPTFVVISFY